MGCGQQTFGGRGGGYAGGNADSIIDLSAAPALKEIRANAFDHFPGKVFVVGAYPLLIKVETNAFHHGWSYSGAVPGRGAGSVFKIACRGPTWTVGIRAFTDFKGDHSDTSGEAISCSDTTSTTTTPTVQSCANGGPALTPALYAQGYAAYKDIACIPEYAFCQHTSVHAHVLERMGPDFNYTLCDSGKAYDGDIMLNGSFDKLTHVEQYAFSSFRGTIAFTGSFPALIDIGPWSFSDNGGSNSHLKTVASVVDLSRAPLLQSLGKGAFQYYKGKILLNGTHSKLTSVADWCFTWGGTNGSIIDLRTASSLQYIGRSAFGHTKVKVMLSGQYPALTNLDYNAFRSSRNTASIVKITCRGPSWRVDSNAFQDFDGNHNDTSGEAIRCTTTTSTTSTATTITSTSTITITTTTASTTSKTITSTTTTYEPQPCHGVLEAATCGTRIQKSDCTAGGVHQQFAEEHCAVMCRLCTCVKWHSCSTTTTTSTPPTDDTATTITTATATKAPVTPKAASNCQDDEFACADGNLCIQAGRACDGYGDCVDGSDEDICDDDTTTTAASTYGTTVITATTTTWLRIHDLCDPRNDGCDYSKGLVCGDTYPYTCRYSTTVITVTSAAPTDAPVITSTALHTEVASGPAASSDVDSGGDSNASGGGGNGGLYACVGIIVVLAGIIALIIWRRSSSSTGIQDKDGAAQRSVVTTAHNSMYNENFGSIGNGVASVAAANNFYDAGVHVDPSAADATYEEIVGNLNSQHGSDVEC